MPAKSKVQQKAAGAALAAKRGDTKLDLQGPSRKMYESMDERQLGNLAATRGRDKPERKRRPG